jgi:hypothetical protein
MSMLPEESRRQLGLSPRNEHPFVTKIFDSSVDLYATINHLEYVKSMSSDMVLDQIVTRFRADYQEELGSFGYKRFMRVLRSCEDRRLLFRFVHMELTFHQFVSRVYG